jgi:hypothetical protein
VGSIKVGTINSPAQLAYEISSTLAASMVRVYFNKRAIKSGEENELWSLDRGDQTTEVFAHRLVLLTNLDSAYAGNAKGDAPYAWLYSTTADFVIIDHIAYVGLPKYIASLK